MNVMLEDLIAIIRSFNPNATQWKHVQVACRLCRSFVNITFLHENSTSIEMETTESASSTLDVWKRSPNPLERHASRFMVLLFAAFQINQNLKFLPFLCQWCCCTLNVSLLTFISHNESPPETTQH